MISEEDFLKWHYAVKMEITMTAIRLIISAWRNNMSQEDIKQLLEQLRKEIIEDYKQIGKINQELNPLLFFSEN